MKAHLVIWIDTEASPPTVVSAGIFSEENPSTMSVAIRPITIYSTFDAVDYDTPRRALEAFVRSERYFDWIVKLLDKPIPYRKS